MDKAKGRYITRELALLRARAPDPPMVSHLDEVDENAIEECIQRELDARLPRLTLAAAAAAEFQKAHVQPIPQGTLGSYPVSLDTTTPLVTPGSAPSSLITPPTPLGTPASALTTLATQTLHAKPGPSTSTHAKRNLHEPRIPAPGCHNCRVLFVENSVLRAMLEAETTRTEELRKMHADKLRAEVRTMLLHILKYCVTVSLANSGSDIEQMCQLDEHFISFQGAKYKRLPKYSPTEAPSYGKYEIVWLSEVNWITKGEGLALLKFNKPALFFSLQWNWSRSSKRT